MRRRGRLGINVAERWRRGRLAISELRLKMVNLIKFEMEFGFRKRV